MITLKDTADWDNRVETKLRRQVISLSMAKLISNQGQQDLAKYISVIDKKVSRLSIEEIACRRVKKQTDRYTKILQDINSSIGYFEQEVVLKTLGA